MMRAFHLLLVAFGLAASVGVADDKLDESKAIEKIELLDGRVKRNETLPGRPVIEIDFQGSKRFNGKYLRLLGPFTGLTALDLSDCLQITDANVSEIGKLKNLTTLNLSNAGITDGGLKEIKELTKLTTLDLNHTRISDDGLKEIVELTQLTKLNLAGTRVTDSGLKELIGFKQLKNLNLSFTRITDVGLREIKELKSVTNLRLSGTKISDAGLKELKELDKLTTLALYGTQIHGDAMEEYGYTAEFTYVEVQRIAVVKLNEMNERITQRNKNPQAVSIDDASLKELRECLPKLKIYK